MQKQIITSSLWMLGGNSLQQVLQFLIFILLARYLSPDIFGYVALATVILDIAAAIGRWGISDVILQRRRVSPLFLSHAFVFSMALATLLALGIVAGTLVFAHFKGFTLVCKLLLWLVPIILSQAAEMVPEAMLRRNLEFKWLAMRNNMAAMLGGLTAVALAFLHMGVYALVAQRLISLGVLLIMVWVAAGRHIRFYPPRAYSAKIFYGLAETGGHMVSSPLAAILGPRLNDLMIGVFLGPAPLGLFKITRRIFDFVTQLTIVPLSSVAQAAFPKLTDDRPALRKLYKQIQGICALGLFPLLAGLALTAKIWVPVVLGEKWNDAIPLVQWSSIGNFPAIVNYFQLPLLIAFRANQLIFYQNIARVLVSVVLTAIGVKFSLLAVVQLLNFMMFAFMVFNWFAVKRIANWSIRENISALLPALIATIGMTAIIALFDHFLAPRSPILDLCITIFLGVASYALINVICFRKRSLYAARELMKMLGRRGSRGNVETIEEEQGIMP